MLENVLIREISVEQSNAPSSFAYEAGMTLLNVILGIKHEFKALW
jgi:hypothetical protein